MNAVIQTLSRIGIVPVIAIDDASKAVPLAKALAAGGLNAAEITFRTPAGEEALRQIAREMPEMLVGAGTVLAREQVDRAADAGARFLVSPGFHSEVTEYALSKGLLMLPGEELRPPGEERVPYPLAVGAGTGALLLDGAQYYPRLAEAHELYEPFSGVKPPGDAGAGLALCACGAPLRGAQVIPDLNASVVNPAVALKLPDPVLPAPA